MRKPPLRLTVAHHGGVPRWCHLVRSASTVNCIDQRTACRPRTRTHSYTLHCLLPGASPVVAADWSTIHKKNERNDVDGSFDDMFADLDSYVPSRSMYAAETDAASPNGKNYDPQRRSDEDGEDGDEAEDSREPASATTASSAAAATPRSEWDECLSSRGETYWFNRKTHESSWVDPRSGIGADGVWIPQIDAKGRTYYYNRRNGKSSWSVPVAQ